MLQLIVDWATQDPDCPALFAPGLLPLTYGRLYIEILRHAHALSKMGIGREDRVALLLPNGSEAAVSFLVASAIAACAPLNPVCTANELDAVLSLIKPKILIGSSNLDPEKREVAAKHSIPVVTATLASERVAGVFSLSAPTSPGGGNDLPLGSPDVTLLLHTSGTTSRPKLVGLTNEHLRRSAQNIARSLRLTPEDRCLNVMPLFHIHGLVGALLSSLSVGASVVCSPGFHSKVFFEWLQDFEPSWYTAVPTIHAAIVARSTQHTDIVKRHSLRFIRSCSAPLPTPVLRDLEQRFGVPVLEAYGMTEAAHQIASNPLPPEIRKSGSVGVATGTEIAILDVRGCKLGPDCEGEIVIRGGNVISHYIGDQSANQESFKDGWFRTGDIGSIDGDGYLFIKGRAKEIINRGGTKISPYEIEEVLINHPNVAEAVVFAIADQRLGEDVAAAIVFHRSDPTATAEICHFASDRLSYFKVPRQIISVDKIPRGPTGKPQRIGLAATLGLTVPPPKNKVEVTLNETRVRLEELFATMWAHIIGIERVGVDENFFDLGGDSLGAMELIEGIEQVTGRNLTLAALFQAPTIRQLAAYAEQGGSGLHPYVVPIQGKGSEPIFFCVDAGPRYLSLARHLGTDRPFIGLLHPFPNSTPIKVIAEFCVKSMRAIQPEGPYFVGGWCSAGLVAYEIAQHLRAQDQEVGLLVLFDSVNPSRLDGLSVVNATFVRTDEFLRKICFHLRSMARLHLSDLVAYFMKRLNRAWHTLTTRTWPARASLEFIRRVSRRDYPDMFMVSRHYRPKPYDGRVLLFRRGLRPISTYLDWKLGWSGLIIGDLDVIEIEGGHEDMFDEPQVECVAAKLGSMLVR